MVCRSRTSGQVAGGDHGIMAGSASAGVELQVPSLLFPANLDKRAVSVY